jgi:predicted acetyltransferase
MKLIVPSLAELPQYADALGRGYYPDNIRQQAAADEELARIAEDPAAFVASLTDPEARGGPVVLADGTTVPRLPGCRLWMWDGEFSGEIRLRWQPGTSTLPDHVLGHIGYAVVPWKRRRGYATRALALVLPEARRRGLQYVELTTDPDNLVSQKVITANGGVFIERFHAERHHKDELRFRIML